MITQDFALPTNTKVHGMFIADCYEMYPEGNVQSATYHHDSKAGHTFLTFTSPEESAAWLKLKYGDYLAIRKPQVFDDHDMLKRIYMKEKITAWQDYRFNYTESKVEKVQYDYQEEKKRLADQVDQDRIAEYKKAFIEGLRKSG